MKLKTKIMFSIMSVIMLLALFTLVESGARLTGSFVERNLKKREEVSLDYSLSSLETSELIYIISEKDGVYFAAHSDAQTSSDSLAELISLIESSGAVLNFDGVNSDESITFEKNVTLTGSLSLSQGGINSYSELLTADNFNLIMPLGTVSIKSGCVRILSGNIKAIAEPAFTLEYSSSSRLEISGGEITSESKDGAISSSMGYVKIAGGKIQNSYDAAIKTVSTAELCGAVEISGFEYDIKTNNPLNLPGYVGSAEKPLRVLYGAEFEKGSATAVFRYASSESVETIELYDVNGESVEIKYFEELNGSDEKNFIAVYLPYEVKFYHGASLYKTEKILKNEAVTAPTPPDENGYLFSGWYTDLKAENPYTFGNPENRDMILYASFSLTVPTFRLNSKSFVYDASERYLSFDELSHPLAEKGSFSFEWYKNSEVISYSSECVPLVSVSDSGEYNCKLTFTYNGDFVSITTPKVTVCIEKSIVEIPIVEPCEYTGFMQYPKVPASELYTADYSAAINAGVYPITFTLIDSMNYKWKESDEKTLCGEYEILKGKNEFLTVPSVGNCFVGGLPSVNVSVKFGTPQVLYSSDGITFSEEVPTVAGNFFVRITVPQTDNYSYIESDILHLVISPEIPIGLKIEKAPLKTDYRAFEALVLDGAEFSVTYNSGRVETVDIASLAVRYKSGESFLVSDTCATVFFEDVSVPLTVNVSPAIYDLSSIDFDSKEVVYNGKRQTVSAVGEIVGKDGVALKLKVTGGGVSVGSYPVTLTFESDSINYELPSPITKTLTVTPLSLTVQFGECVFTYDGVPKIPTATAIGAEGRIINLTVSGGATDAGIYTATAHTDDTNYSLANNETEFEIRKANIDFSKVTWSASELIYNGTAQTVSVSGIPENVVLAGYTDSTFTEAGMYRATASIVYDTKNYNEPPALIHEWAIIPAEYDFSDCFFIDSEYIYDGELHYPRMKGSIPVGLDSSSPIYSFSHGACHVSEGVVLVSINFLSQSKNYNAPRSITASVRILPKPINVTWGGMNFVYDGNAHLPSASSDLCELKISGEATDAGTYTAKVSTSNSDYTINNSEVSFVISKSYNSWTSTPIVGVQFEGKPPLPHAKAYYGEVLYAYYSDSEMKNPITIPVSRGTYYMVAYVPESKNYLYLSHAPVEVSIVEIKPIEFVVNINPDKLVAMESLDGDGIYAYVRNNDGSIRELSFSDLAVEYENGSGFRAKDGKLTVSYGMFIKNIDIEVKKSVYDMSDARWDVTHAVYSGNPVNPMLCGLPAGVSVERYTHSASINAGSYPLGAVLSYDSENYLEPVLPEALLTITPREIPLPEIESAVYDGTLKNIILPSDAVYSADFAGATSAGTYEIHLVPNDRLNYTLAGEGTVYFEILRAPITLQPHAAADGYSLVSGTLFGDALGEEYYTESGYVYIRISNPNYELTVVPVKDNTPSKIWQIFIIIMIIIILILCIVMAYTRREKLIAVISGLAERSESHSGKEKVNTTSASVGSAENAEPPLDLLLAVDESHANSLISDSLAKNLVSESEVTVETEGKRKCIVNLDTISACFSAGDVVDVNKMKEKEIVPRDAKRIKVLARGVIDKPLTVIADSFSLSAVKMIALTGGRAIRVRSGSRPRFKKK